MNESDLQPISGRKRGRSSHHLKDDNSEENIPPEEWKGLFCGIIQTMELQKFTTRWMKHPRINEFINWMNGDGDTILTWAIRLGRLDIVKALLEHGASVLTRNKQGWTALMVACFYEHAEIVSLLLNNGSDTRAVNERGDTALSIAHFEEHTPIVKLLLAAICDDPAIPVEWVEIIFNTNKDSIAFIEFDIFATQFMANPMKESFINWKNDYIADGKPMLLCAMTRWEIAHLLLNHGADPNISDNNGLTALMVASNTGQINAVKVLLEKGAHANATKTKRLVNGCTPLMFASRNGHAEIAKLLVEKGAKINLVCKNSGFSALLHASRNGHADIVKFLLSKGADIRIRNHDGKTALGLACQYGHSEVIKILIQSGADPNRKNNSGDTPLHLAMTVHMRSPNGRYLDTIKTLHEHGADFDIQNSEGMTPLQRACQQDYLEVVELLLRLGVNPNTTTTQGTTALQVASMQNHFEIVWFMVRQYSSSVLEQD